LLTAPTACTRTIINLIPSFCLHLARYCYHTIPRGNNHFIRQRRTNCSSHHRFFHSQCRFFDRHTSNPSQFSHNFLLRMSERDAGWDFHLRTLSISARDSNIANDPASDPSLLQSVQFSHFHLNIFSIYLSLYIYMNMIFYYYHCYCFD
jgi:hypothetical protein